MLKVKTAFVFLVVVLLPVVMSGAAKHPVTIDDVMSMKTVDGVAISPDGLHVLYTVSGWEWPGGTVEPDKGAKPPETRSHVWMVSTEGDPMAHQITFGEKGESAPAWSPDGKYISFVAARGQAAGSDGDGPKFQIWIMRADGGEAWQLTDAKEGVGHYSWALHYSWAPNGKTIAYLTDDSLPKEVEERHKRKDDSHPFEEDFQMTHIWIINVESKKAEQITSGKDFTVLSLTWSPDSTHIAFGNMPTPMTRDDRNDIFVVTVATKEVEKIAATTARESGPAWSPDGKTIAYALIPNPVKPNPDGMSVRPLGNDHLVIYDVATKKTKDVYDPAFDLSVGGLVWAPDSKRILFSLGHRVYQEMFAYDVAANRYEQLTRRTVLNFNVNGQSQDGSKVAFTMESSAAPSDIYVSDATFSSPRKLTTVNPQVADLALGESEVITWKSNDGLEIEGLLLKPVGYEATKHYPLLVNVHGGPTESHSNDFKMGLYNESGQFWAGQGWAVLYPNPRGSTGYGEKFVRGNVPDWGGGDYRDIMTGVDDVIQRGIADPDKLAVMGWSYGGYMTCWIVSQTSRFKAARMGAGLSDIYSMYGTTDIPGYFGTFFKGYPTKDTIPLYLERSGLTYADKVTTPLLIMHGTNDERVPIGQPMEFYRALKDRGKIVQFVWYPREGHAFMEYYHRRDQLRREFEWITKYTLSATQQKAADK